MLRISHRARSTVVAQSLLMNATTGGRIMMNTTEIDQSNGKRAGLKRVAVIGGQPDWTSVLNTALADITDCDVILVDTFDHAYSSIKRSVPDLIVASMACRDEQGCLVLSMLKADRTTCDIPVALCLADDAHREEPMDSPATRSLR
jgi:hypothetical protein